MIYFKILLIVLISAPVIALAVHLFSNVLKFVRQQNAQSGDIKRKKRKRK